MRERKREEGWREEGLRRAVCSGNKGRKKGTTKGRKGGSGVVMCTIRHEHKGSRMEREANEGKLYNTRRGKKNERESVREVER